MQTPHRKGSARVLLTGFSLLGLLIVVAIIVTLAGTQAEKATQAKKSAEETIEEKIQRPLDAYGERINEAMGDIAGDAKGGSYDVILADAGPGADRVIAAIREVTGLGPKDARSIVEGAPSHVERGITRSRAERVRRRLEAAGARVELRRRAPQRGRTLR
jgi:ribosomal protein L7/L12